MKSLFEEMGGTYRQEGDYLIPNLVGLFALSGVVAKLTKEHFSDPAAMLEDEMYT